MPLPTGRALLDAPAILQKAGLSVGMRYADFGAGTLGHFVFPATSMVGDNGHVFAVDILKGALAGIESRARLEQVSNLETVWADIERPGGVAIDDESLDLVTFVNITGLILKSPTVLEEAKRLLKPGATLVLVDWKRAGGGFGPPAEKRPDPAAVRQAAEAAGFKLVEEFEAGKHHWGSRFVAP
jgi:ubiquinone/menaquinone biosynthesis C-methylase UbiE